MLLVGLRWLVLIAFATGCGFTELTRLGVGMPATQSSLYEAAVAGLAVDGNANQDFHAGSCSCTLTSPVPMFWAVDLQGIYILERIKIYNRFDSCCAYRLTDFRVYVGLTELTYVEIAHHPGTVGSTVEFDISGIYGRFVKIEKYSHDHLTLCEVEIYGYGTTCTGHFVKIPGSVGTGAVLQSTAVSSSKQCSAICTATSACRGYNLRQDGGSEICEILNATENAIGTNSTSLFLPV